MSSFTLIDVLSDVAQKAAALHEARQLATNAEANARAAIRSKADEKGTGYRSDADTRQPKR